MATLELNRPDEKISRAFPRASESEQNLFLDSITNFYNNLRKEAVNALMTEGYEKDDIRKVLDSEDFFFKSLNENEKEKILNELIPENFIGGETGLSAISVYRNVVENNAFELFNLVRPHDLKVVCSLLDEGYPVPDIVATQKQHSIISRYYHGKDIDGYFDSVWSDVNRSRTILAGRKLEACRAAYIAKANADMVLLTPPLRLINARVFTAQPPLIIYY